MSAGKIVVESGRSAQLPTCEQGAELRHSFRQEGCGWRRPLRMDRRPPPLVRKLVRPIEHLIVAPDFARIRKNIAALPDPQQHALEINLDELDPAGGRRTPKVRERLGRASATVGKL